jgi:hypothetical protein
LSEIANVLKKRLGDKAKKVPIRKLLHWVVRFVGLFDNEVRGQLFELGKVQRPSSAKAEKDLGLSFSPGVTGHDLGPSDLLNHQAVIRHQPQCWFKLGDTADRDEVGPTRTIFPESGVKNGARRA